MARTQEQWRQNCTGTQPWFTTRRLPLPPRVQWAKASHAGLRSKEGEGKDIWRHALCQVSQLWWIWSKDSLEMEQHLRNRVRYWTIQIGLVIIKRNHNPGFWDALGLKHPFSGFLKPQSMDLWISKSHRNYVQKGVCVCVCVYVYMGISLDRESVVHQTHKKENVNNSCIKLLWEKGINCLGGLWKESLWTDEVLGRTYGEK